MQDPIDSSTVLLCTEGLSWVNIGIIIIIIIIIIIYVDHMTVVMFKTACL